MILLGCHAGSAVRAPPECGELGALVLCRAVLGGRSAVGRSSQVADRVRLGWKPGAGGCHACTLQGVGGGKWRGDAERDYACVTQKQTAYQIEHV